MRLVLPLAMALLPACAGPAPWSDSAGHVSGRPEIQALELSCDLDEERWRLQVETRFWTGGGRLYWTLDGDRIENHYVRSISAEGDGSADVLRLDLAIVGDWREAQPGSSTAVHCGHDPTGLFLLYDADGTEVACHRFGPDPELWGTDDRPACSSPEWFAPES